jgi:hypothetical protein
MILGIDVAFIHTPHRALADWYADVLDLPKGYGDEGWQSFQVNEGSRFATFLDPDGNWMQLSQRKVVGESQ